MSVLVCRSDGTHKKAAQSIFWTFSDSQRWVTWMSVRQKNVLEFLKCLKPLLFHSCGLYFLLTVLSAFGDVFAIIGVREPQAAASEAFVKFADAHRNIEKYGIQLLKTIKPVSAVHLSWVESYQVLNWKYSSLTFCHKFQKILIQKTVTCLISY